MSRPARSAISFVIMASVHEDKKAIQNLSSLVLEINELFAEEKIHFDFVLFSGDSGQSVSYIFRKILEGIGVDAPPILVLPYYRFSKKYIPRGIPFDNKVLLDDVNGFLSNIQNLDNILFVDDEIGEGRTISGIVDLINKENAKKFGKDSRIYIVAEDHGFKKEEIGGIPVLFEPLSKKTEHVYNAISYLVPFEMEKAVEKDFRKLNSKELINCLLDLPVKARKGDSPYWSYELLEEVKEKVVDFEGMQFKFAEYLNGLIRDDIRRLKS